MSSRLKSLVPLAAWSSCVIALGIIGCGGGGGGGSSSSGSVGGSSTRFDATITSTSSTIDDGGRYVSLGLVGAKTGSAKITAASSAFDPMLVVEKINDDGSSEVVAEDDDGGGGTSAQVTFAVTSGTHYTVLTTSVSGDPRGNVAITYPASALTPDGRGRSAPADAKRK